MFKFNVTGLPTNNTKGGSVVKITQIAKENGILSSAKDYSGNNQVAHAAVVTNRSTNGSLGLSNGVFVSESIGSPKITLAHEIGHTLKLKDTYPNNTGGLMDYPPGGLIPSEVDTIWEKAYEK